MVTTMSPEQFWAGPRNSASEGLLEAFADRLCGPMNAALVEELAGYMELAHAEGYVSEAHIGMMRFFSHKRLTAIMCRTAESRTGP